MSDNPVATHVSTYPEVAISHRVKPDKMEAFSVWSEDIANVMSQAPGFLDYQSLPPVEGAQQEWMIVFQFDTAENLRAWINSKTRADLVAKSEELVEPNWCTEITSSSLEQLLGLLPVGKAPRPPLWKLMVITYMGLFPTVAALAYTVARIWTHWPLLLQIMFSTACSVVLMTSFVMPTLFHLLHGWLQPGTKAPSLRR